ncbi:hypothetical protein DB30_01755 [Enhygromyxa salina]|uniref:Uncharacterized protein n=1 Tax=Enhygromyxa salina TaxID=215803 RepID=A0A0C1ZMK6_9BACT|nr:hypothetical protein DB30_01755 [Enhygromyxa salina]
MRVRELAQHVRDQLGVVGSLHALQQRAQLGDRQLVGLRQPLERAVVEAVEVAVMAKGVALERGAADARWIQAGRHGSVGVLDLALVVEGQVEPTADVLERRGGITGEAEQRLAVADLPSAAGLAVALDPRVEQLGDLGTCAVVRLVLQREAVMKIVVLGAGDQLREGFAAVVRERDCFELLNVHDGSAWVQSLLDLRAWQGDWDPMLALENGRPRTALVRVCCVEQETS